jgi:hypothetical protein
MEFDDDDLLELLELNEFEPSQENLAMLKQGISEGIVEFLDTTGISLEEGSDPDYGWMQILDKNGFTMTEDNVRLLKDDYESGKALLFTEWWLGDRIRKHKIRKLRRKRMQDYNAKKKEEKEAAASDDKPTEGTDLVADAQAKAAPDKK